MKKQSKTKLGQGLIEGLESALSHERGEVKLKTSRRKLAPPAPEFTKTQIKHLRIEILDCTQEELAALLNVDLGTIRHWEQGLRKPTSSANRLLQLFMERPELTVELKGA